uniref:Large ribosomal subunit protein bL35m n=1 Tax=Strix occidentalis caurina TaxID=311401 RepID=A0A8D0FZQ8_STROC
MCKRGTRTAPPDSGAGAVGLCGALRGGERLSPAPRWGTRRTWPIVARTGRSEGGSGSAPPHPRRSVTFAGRRRRGAGTWRRRWRAELWRVGGVRRARGGGRPCRVGPGGAGLALRRDPGALGPLGRPLVTSLLPSILQQPARTVTYYSLRKGKRKTVKAVIDRFLRLHNGLWVRRKAGYKKKLWKKSAAQRKRLRELVLCNRTQCKLLDKMTTSFWKRRNWSNWSPTCSDIC